MNMTKIAEGLRLIADGLEDGSDKKADTKVKPSVQADTKPGKSEPKTKEKEQPAEKAEATTAPDAEVTKAEVIQALQLVAKKHGRERIDKILADFNVDKVGKLAESDFADVITLAEEALA